MSILSQPNIPKPLHGLSPRTILGQTKWDILRKSVYKKYNNRCACCGASGRMEAHEVYDIDYEKGIATYKTIYALCHECHSFIHSGLLEKLYTDNTITREKYIHILRHGVKILKEQSGKIFIGTYHQCIKNNIDVSGLQIMKVPDKIAEFGKWKLVINGREFDSKIKNMEEWSKKYGI